MAWYLGLSGGIDSGLTLAIAVDALGADRVRAVMMPYHYTSDISKIDAAEQARLLGVRYDVISIEPIVTAALGQLAGCVRGLRRGHHRRESAKPRPLHGVNGHVEQDWRHVADDRQQERDGRRLRNALRRYGGRFRADQGLPEVAGVCAGAVSQYGVTGHSGTGHYAAAIGRAAPDQEDTDSLPPYDILDPILSAFIEEDLSVQEIVERGFDFDTVVRVLTMVRRNEYKRRQAPPGIRISERAFGRDWRYPITSGYRIPST